MTNEIGSPPHTKPPPHQADLICVGGGLGGLVAAVRAHDLGLSVVVLEASDKLGGVAAYSGGIIWAPGNHLQPADTRAADLEAGMAYLDHVGGIGLPYDKDLRYALVTTTAEAIEYLTSEAGIDVRSAGVPDQFHGHVDAGSGGDRTLEALTDGIDLGQWLDVLRDGPFQPPWLLASEAVVHHTPDEAYAAVGAGELRRRRDRRVLVRGRGLVGGLLRAALGRGIELRLQERVTRLLVEEDAIVGVVVDNGSERHVISAGCGVLIATGSYGYAPWRTELEGLPEVYDQGPPVTHGDGVTLTDPTPAALVRGGSGFTVLGYVSPTRTHTGTDLPLHIPLWDSLGYPHSIVVNADGRRFGDESHYTTFTGAINRYDAATKRYPNHPAFLVVDDQFRENGYILGDTTNPWPEQAMVCADTLTDLATLLGVDPDVLQRTIATYNADVEVGRDSEFGRGSIRKARERHGDPAYPQPNLGSLGRPPFWGLPLTILAAGVYSHGLRVSPRAEVLDRAGKPVLGLYATGNAVAYTELPGGYENGVANARNISYAYLAAASAAQRMPTRSRRQDEL